MMFKLILSSIKFNLVLTKFDRILENCARDYLFKYNELLPLLNANSLQINQKIQKQTSDFNLNDILSDGFMWYCPTPKHRTSAEKKLTKRFTPLPNNWIIKYSKPKRNIIACLECGSYHEMGTICGKCYESVKEKTVKMQEEMRNKSSLK